MKNQKQNILDINQIIDKLKASDRINQKSPFVLSEPQVEALCLAAKHTFMTQPILLQLQPPTIVCGDIHGQYKDLVKIFQRLGDPSDRTYLFLGDYVDRGKKSLECVCLLLAYKVKYPLNFFMLRGNHESSQLNKSYGFYDQCNRRMSIKTFKIFQILFACLPVAAVIGGRIFCVHGGPSPLLKQLHLINKIKRPVLFQQNKLVSDMLWSDPSYLTDVWQGNVDRGIGFIYGKKVVNQFLKTHGFDFICRSHQVVEQGYEFFNQRTVLTIFSAPNYCGEFQNFGGVLIVNSKMVCHIEQFKGQVEKTVKKMTITRHVTPLKVQFKHIINENQQKIQQTKSLLLRNRRPTNLDLNCKSLEDQYQKQNCKSPLSPRPYRHSHT